MTNHENSTAPNFRFSYIIIMHLILQNSAIIFLFLVATNLMANTIRASDNLTSMPEAKNTQ